MEVPEQSAMHNYAYNPSVASWVHSTSLAQLDTQPDDAPPDPSSPDDFYKSAYPPPSHGPDHEPAQLAAHPPPLSSSSIDMATTRQRQHTPNGAALLRSTAKPTVRSVSGPATSTATTASRTTPHLPGNRPTVRSLAQKFSNQPTATSSSSVETSPSVARRPIRPSAAASSVRSTTESSPAPAPASASPSPARPNKEAAYGSYKFNNLKPRERPQPAPASPASARRSNRSATGDQVKSPARRKLASPIREVPGSSGSAGSRKPFFGEVVGEHDASLPGFGIPTLDPVSTESSEPFSSPPRPPHNTTIKLVTDESVLAPERAASEPPDVRYESGSHHFQQDATTTTRPGASDGHHHFPQQQESESLSSPSSQRRSPRSRIPVASRRMSTTSDSSSSNRSLKFSGARPVQYNRTSPTRLTRKPVGKGTTSPPKPQSPAAAAPLPAVSYHRGYRERGKSPKGPKSGPSVAAVITAPPPPSSPRLRNSRERQMLQESPGAKSASPQTPQDYFGDNTSFTKEHDPHATHVEHTDGRSNFQNPTHEHADQQPANGLDSNAPFLPHEQQTQSVESLSLRLLPSQQPTSTMTSFEDESPILGIPGSFIMTPPLVQQSSPLQPQVEEPQRKSIILVEPEPEPAPLLLQPNVFRAPSPDKGLAPDSLNIALSTIGPSELGVRESIPIMLGSDDPRADWEDPVKQPRHSPRLDIDAHHHHRHHHHANDDTHHMPGTINYYEEDSPINHISRHESLRPEDSVSVAFYQQTQNRAPEWTPRVPNVPEAGSFTLDSEAYSVINKVLNMYHQSEAISPDLASDSKMRVHAVSPIIAQHKDWGSKEATETYLARLLSDANGVDEPNKDSKPPATEQSSNRGSIPSLSIRDLEEEPADFHAAGTAIIFPVESRRYSRSSRGSATTTIADDASRPDSSSGNQAPSSSDANAYHLPQIAWSNEGLGLSLQNSHQPQQPTFSPLQQPVRPQYSPPPPPGAVSNEHLPAVSYNPATDFSTKYNALSDLNPSPYLKSTQPAKAPVVSIHSHPARTNTPVKEQTLEDRYGTPQPVVVEESVNDSDTFKVVDQDASTLASTDAPTATDQPDSEEKQALKKKFRIVQEMLKTEHGFCIDMMIAHNIFESTAHNVMDEKERRTLFSNCKELEKFSLQLFRMLKKAAKPIIHYDVEEGPPGPWSRDLVNGITYNSPDDSIKLRNAEDDKYHDEFEKCTPENDRETTIGNVFLETAPKMERLFTTYFLNHNNACEYIKKNSAKSEVMGWVTACFQQVEGLTQAWDLDSLLVKPCQRLLKYPLLLEQLEQVTTANHPDLKNIIAARKQLVEISGRINQAKKRSETLRAATSEGQKKEKSKGLGIGKNIVKAFTSKQDKTKAYEEAAALFRDDEYRKLSQKFGGHFFQLQIVLRDFECYLEAITEHYLQLNIVLLGFITVSETGPSCHPEMESTWRKWAMAHFELQNKALEEHKTAVRSRALKPISDLWSVWIQYQKTMETRKKALLNWAKHKAALDRNEKIDSELEKQAKAFVTINDTLKHELPLLYDKTKVLMRYLMVLFMSQQKDWFKTCSKKILPLLETEPQHTTSMPYDLKAYVDRFKSDWNPMEAYANRLAIVNRSVLADIASISSPVPTMNSEDGNSSRNSSSRRTESIGSEMSALEPRGRNSGGYGQRSGMRSFEGPPRSSPAGAAYPSITQVGASRAGPGPSSLRELRALSPASDDSDVTVTTMGSGRPRGSSRARNYMASLDGAFDDDPYALPPSIGASFLSPTLPSSQPVSQPTSAPGSSRTSGVFNSALPMSDSPVRASVEDLPATPGEQDEPEVLFLAASLFEFNIAHDRREGGIPYLVYVPGEIFDVIGMKGELWLARNQDDPSRTVGWIWEKHFARILPEDA